MKSRQEEQYQKKRLRNSYVPVVISISLVLFLFGSMVLLVFNASIISNHIKENFALTLYIHDDASITHVKELQRELAFSKHVKSTEYIPKEEAAQRLKDELQEDFIAFLGTNPLKNSIEVYLNAQYASPRDMQKLRKKFDSNPLIAEATYDKSLIKKVWQNTRIITFWILIMSLMLLIISMVLINNTIRLSIYSHRFLIKTMQLVGATKKFIITPFIRRGITFGVVGASLAIGMLGTLTYYLEGMVEGFHGLSDITFFIFLCVLLLLMGIIICGLSVSFSVNRFLKVRVEDLYF